MQNIHICSCVNTWNYSSTLRRPEHSLTHKAKDILVLTRMEKAAASTEVLSHLHDSVHKGSTLTFFTTLTPTWQKIFCCAKSEMGTRPSWGHTSVTEPAYIILQLYTRVSLSCFFLKKQLHRQTICICLEKSGFYSCGSSGT